MDETVAQLPGSTLSVFIYTQLSLQLVISSSRRKPGNKTNLVVRMRKEKFYSVRYDGKPTPPPLASQLGQRKAYDGDERRTGRLTEDKYGQRGHQFPIHEQ